MRIFPAIDIKNGQIVRLTEGKYDQVKVYSKDPEEVLEHFTKEGATALHIVDLDGAKSGTIENQNTIKTILKNRHFVTQLGGGIRDESTINHYLNMGVDRVILGTVAVENPKFVEEMVKKYDQQIAVGVDEKDGQVRANGWLVNSKVDAIEFCKMLTAMGVATIIYTDISKDGMMAGCDMASYRQLCKDRKVNIIASGGVTSIAEIKELKRIGVAGVIVGKAIYEGKIALREATAIC
ncbi:1-(5-phosphoribosyl)-5-[(5-phosphoribosylamino)methylideneamino]imidazole-4-carboxamide isomerase [Candidatus Epulonipiscium viviparus]|uniref:1-(5-phosphoribosyl)-5-[(5- phosphoribosylamino)methylideneamino]imidazole-4- carboxamide isomerase n=1 Tax=Candidatus Epulonipiscium viviparus TaxID=420336 RepID=UPI00016BFDF6|nr:1-(5-phosphoribosyl)-5-[(5-phosphoribosylamino)methylideneamino]imidazole-4-carboxamide isomerase [Candidatus Epulopiscium viviparus]